MGYRRVLLASEMYWPDVGGAESANHLIAKKLAKSFEVDVISGTNLPTSEVRDFHSYTCWPALRSSFKFETWVRMASSFRSVRGLLSSADIVVIASHSILPLALLVKRANPTVRVVVHLHDYQPIATTSVILSGMRPSMRNDILVELEEHGNVPKALASGVLRPLNVINRKAVIVADAVVCESNRQKEIVCRSIPSSRNKVQVIYNPPPTLPEIKKEFSPVPSFLFVGGGSYVKGIRLIMSAIQALSREGFEFILAGSRLDRFRVPSQISGQVSVVGRIAQADLFTAYSRVHGLLFPSVSEEPLPYAVVESCLLKTMPVASAAGGVVELLKGSPAEQFLFGPNDEKSMIESVRRLAATDESQLRVWGEDLRRHISEKLDSSSEDYIHLLTELI